MLTARQVPNAPAPLGVRGGGTVRLRYTTTPFRGLLTALPAWLSLTRSQRQDVVAEDVEPALADHPMCRTRWIDVEAFSATCSDVMLVDFTDWMAWNHLWERLRDTRLFAEPYFRLESLLVGVQDGYREYEASIGDSA